MDCKIGRESSKWIDLNFYGHQISAHLIKKKNIITSNIVDGKNIPIRHFGIILDWDNWKALSARLKKNKIKFLVSPYIRFKGEIGEQATMFLKDPSDNILEFKSFKNDESIFSK